MAVTPVFISYDRRDRYFVNLLRALLEREGVDNRCDTDRLDAGDKYQARILDGLEECRSLIAVISEHAVDSRWVTGETSAFCASNPEAVVIPIVLDATAPVRVFGMLGAYQAVDMSEDMLQGFTALLDRFDRAFLSGQGQRRSNKERRTCRDRRQHPLRRLRTGLWQSYAQATGEGKFSQLDFARATQRSRIAEALHTEIARYEFYDEKHRRIDARWALDQALEALVAPKVENEKAIYIIEKVASYLNEHYEVKSRDRRRGTDRRVDAK